MQIDRFVRRNTTERFGPVREVVHEPDQGLVLEVAFEGLQRSTRHKSGLAMRFPRINRLRWDKPPGEADRLERLETMIARIEQGRAGAAAVRKPSRPPAAKLRRGRMSDLDALLALEQAVFTTDHPVAAKLSPFSRLTEVATLIVAEAAGKLAGYALVLYPPRSMLARLYSIAVAPHFGRRGVGPLLLAAAERGGAAPRLPGHAAGSPRA